MCSRSMSAMDLIAVCCGWTKPMCGMIGVGQNPRVNWQVLHNKSARVLVGVGQNPCAMPYDSSFKLFVPPRSSALP